MEHCFLEGGFYISVLGVVIFCKNLTLYLGCKCRTQEVNHFLSGSLLATERTVLPCCELCGPNDKTYVSVAGD